MKKALFLLAVSALAAVPVSAMTIRVSDPRVELELVPGETVSGEIIVENPSEDSNTARIYLEDWTYTAAGNGDKDFSPAGSLPLSASPWITFAPAEAPLPAFGRVTVRYTVKVPQDAKGGYYSVLFFETFLGRAQDPNREEGAFVNLAGRVGTLFLIEVKGTAVRSGKITDVTFTAPEGNEPFEIATTFQNSGNVDVTVGGNFLLMNDQGDVVARGELGKIFTFPGMTSSGVSKWVGRLPKGSYQALLTYDLGKGVNLVEERTLTVP